MSISNCKLSKPLMDDVAQVPGHGGLTRFDTNAAEMQARLCCCCTALEATGARRRSHKLDVTFDQLVASPVTQEELACCSDHWRKNLPAIGKTCRAYAIDLLGYGFSDKPDPRQVSQCKPVLRQPL